MATPGRADTTACVTGGPKLRKWYGEGELPADGGSAVIEKMPEPEDIAPEDVKRDAILVTDADSPTGEQVVLQLILARYLYCPVLRLSTNSFVDCCRLCLPAADDCLQYLTVVCTWLCSNFPSVETLDVRTLPT